MIRNDINCIYKILKDIVKEEKEAVLMIGWLEYFSLITIEAIKYLDSKIDTLNIRKNMNNKKAIESCRARLKPYNTEYENFYNDIEKLNEEKLKEFENYTIKKVPKFLRFIIDNYGTYSINNKIIFNTFLSEYLYKKMLISPEKMFDVGKEIGQNIKIISKLLGIKENDYKGEKRNFKIIDNDYNVYIQPNLLFKDYIDSNYGLLLLNNISLMNFYTEVITKMTNNEFLKYRIAYIIYDCTSSNLKKMNIVKDIPKLKDILNAMEILNNRDFRNCMYHYNIESVINEDEIKMNLFFGLIEKCLKIEIEEYKSALDYYLLLLPRIIENYILK
jgi:hypothetical protein